MKKNKIILILVFGTIVFSPLFIIQAATSDTITTTSLQKATDLEIKKAKEEAVKKMKEKEIEANKNTELRKKEIEKRIKENNQEEKTILKLKKLENVKSLLEKIFNQLLDKQLKLTEVDKKISAMIKTSKDEGKDVSLLENEYKIVKMNFEKAKGDIFETRIITMEQIKVATSKSVLRDMIKTSEDKLKAIGAEYRKLIPMLAKLEGDNSINN